MARSNLHKMVNGQEVHVTFGEAKKEIMKQHGWTKEEYKKHYDIFKNKLRAFEAFERAHGANVETQSAVELMYKQAKAMKRQGSEYKPSIKMQRINSFTSVSSGKVGHKALTSKKYMARRASSYSSATTAQFEGFIANNPQAQEIMQTITDPVIREKALADLADKINAKIDEQGKVAKNGQPPMSSEVVGSTDALDDFDMDYWLSQDVTDEE